jgi:predicted RNA-binding Zn ribbon-like protein
MPGSGVEVLFAHDTSAALTLATDLVNTLRPGDDALTDAAALDEFLGRHHVTPPRSATEADLAAVGALRPRLRLVWEAPGPGELAVLVNDLLRDSDARPWLTDHGGGWGWHLHVTEPAAPLGHRIGAQAAFAFADLVRLRETDRLRRCDVPACEAVLIDLSRNRSRRYCDTGNCGNRQHVAAYRARIALAGGHMPAEPGGSHALKWVTAAEWPPR